jgi:hypothetical protein
VLKDLIAVPQKGERCGGEIFWTVVAAAALTKAKRQLSVGYFNKFDLLSASAILNLISTLSGFSKY